MAMKQPFVVRPIGEGDAPQILLLARTLDKWFNAGGLTKLGRDLDSHEGFVAVRGERLLGFVTWNAPAKEVAELSWMGVAEGEQHKGIGTALLSTLISELRASGYQFLEVSTVAESVDYEPYAETRRFYRARGFVNHRVDPKYWGEADDRYDRLVLRLALSRALLETRG